MIVYKGLLSKFPLTWPANMYSIWKMVSHPFKFLIIMGIYVLAAMCAFIKLSLERLLMLKDKIKAFYREHTLIVIRSRQSLLTHTMSLFFPNTGIVLEKFVLQHTRTNTFHSM